jgi:DNA-binding protein HU-beta
MNKAELIMAVAGETGLSKKDVEAALNATMKTITDALAQEEKVQIVGFGSFETKHRAERMGRNPRTKEDVLIPATKIPLFKAGKVLRDAVAQ